MPWARPRDLSPAGMVCAFAGLLRDPARSAAHSLRGPGPAAWRGTQARPQRRQTCGYPGEKCALQSQRSAQALFSTVVTTSITFCKLQQT